MEMQGEVAPGYILEPTLPSISSLASGPSSRKQPSLCWAISEEVSRGHMKAQRVCDWDGRRQDGEGFRATFSHLCHEKFKLYSRLLLGLQVKPFLPMASLAGS